MLDKVRKILFFLIVFFSSSQVGLHFWPAFSFINGIRIDYLSPTLYLLDILIILFILLNFKLLFRIKFAINKISAALLALFFLSILLNIFISKSPAVHLFGMLKLVEFGLFGLLIAKTFDRIYIRPFVIMLATSAIISSVLAIWQFIKQSSIGGLWYFLGERTFNISTIGISTVNLDYLVLRPYAAFPHPNVLAFFFLATTAFTVFRLPYEKNSAVKGVLISSILLSTVGIVLTFSRITILLAICFFFYAIYTKGKRNVMLIVLGLLGLLGLVSIFFPDVLSAQFLLRGIDFRQDLLIQSFQIFLGNPYFGIGLNNFFVDQVDLIKNISPILFQPPHNIFVLAFLSLGIFGWWIFPAMFIFAIRSLINKPTANSQQPTAFYRSTLFVLISIIVVGMFDHFFLTLEQGQIMLALVLGLSFAKLKS